MKKIFVSLLLSVSVWGGTPVFEKVRAMVGDTVFFRNEAFIKIIFSDRNTYEKAGQIDVVSIVKTLKDNGLMRLGYGRSRTLELTFETNGAPQFFMTLMGDTLRDMGYYNYLTDSAQLSKSGYVWRIRMEAESAVDPAALQQKLAERGCRIFDIERSGDTQWRYFIDMGGAHLNLTPLALGEKVTMKRLVYPRWLDVSQANQLTLWSLKGNNWYPYIAFYDDDLRLLKLYKRDKKSWQIIINLPRGCAYVKIADLYSRKNMNAGLSVKAQ